jgi:uncharacterized protein (DUF1697 family)
MHTHIAFLRAINVAGHAIIKMTDLKRAFEDAGCGNVATVIQSGNVMFATPDPQCADLFVKIRLKVRGLTGSEPGIVFRTIRDMKRLVQSAPFADIEAGRAVKFYVAFLSQKPGTKVRFPLVSAAEALEVIGMRDKDVFIVSRPKPNGFFGFPNNFIEKELGVSATTRNWSTVMRIAGLSGDHSPKAEP